MNDVVPGQLRKLLGQCCETLSAYSPSEAIAAIGGVIAPTLCPYGRVVINVGRRKAGAAATNVNYALSLRLVHYHPADDRRHPHAGQIDRRVGRQGVVGHGTGLGGRRREGRGEDGTGCRHKPNGGGGSRPGRVGKVVCLYR